MNKNAKIDFLLAGVFGFLFILLIVLLKTVDVQNIGPEGTAIGFAGINAAFHNATGYKDGLYTLTKLLGIVAILLVVFWAGLGVFQWIKRKSIIMVSRSILAAGGLYAVFAALYVLFEKVIINYRPMIMEGDEHVEASFPSTHTMLACVVFGSSILLIRRFVKHDILRMVLQILCGIAILTTVVGRLFCGVHWLTDICGGVLISAALVFAYAGVLRIWRRKKPKRKKGKGRR